MTTLREALADPVKRAAALIDTQKLIESEVDRKRGLTGLALRAGYGVVKAFKPGFIQETIELLLDESAEKLEPILAEPSDTPLVDRFVREKSRVAETLLQVTDAKAAGTKLAAIKAAYDSLRGSAKAHVEEAVPGLGAVIARLVA